MTGVENNLSRFLQELCFLKFKHLKQILNLQCFLNQLLLTQHILDITISVSKYLRVNSTFASLHFFDTYIHTCLNSFTADGCLVGLPVLILGQVVHPGGPLNIQMLRPR